MTPNDPTIAGKRLTSKLQVRVTSDTQKIQYSDWPNDVQRYI